MGARSGGGGGGYGRYYSQYNPSISINQSNGSGTVSFNSRLKGKKNKVTFDTLKDATTFANKLSKSGYQPAMNFALKKKVSVDNMKLY